jgi:hypothetical protein
MSNSFKKPIVKDKTNHKWYNRVFRRVNKQRIKSGKRPFLMNEIINPWDVTDWIYGYWVYDENNEDDVKWVNKMRRK